MTISPRHQTFVEEFLSLVEPLHEANQNEKTFSYVAIKHEEQFYLVIGRLAFNAAPTKTPFSHFQSKNIRAGNYRLSELNLDARGLIDALISGRLATPHGTLIFPPNEFGTFSVAREPFHQEGIKAQARCDVLTLWGGSLEPYLVHKAKFDWELRAAPTHMTVLTNSPLSINWADSAELLT